MKGLCIKRGEMRMRKFKLLFMFMACIAGCMFYSEKSVASELIFLVKSINGKSVEKSNLDLTVQPKEKKK